MKIYCFGNEFVKDDALAKTIVDDISMEDVSFVKCNSPEELLEVKGDIVILDVVKDISEVLLIKDIDQLKDRSIVSLHDFDLAYFLKMLKSLGRVSDITIIGIPMKGDEKAIRRDVIKQISSL